MPITQNPHHPIPDEVAAGFAKLRDAQLGRLANQRRIAQLGQPTADEQQRLTQLQQVVATALGLSAEQQQVLDDLKLGRYKRVLNALQELQQVDPREFAHVSDVLNETLPPPPPTDRNFWFASTDFWFDPADVDDLRAFKEPDGTHVSGSPSANDSNGRWEYAYVNATFELQRERIPASPSALWTSTPAVDVSGGVLATTGSPNLGGVVGGDLVAQFKMSRRQSIMQFPIGGVPLIIAQAIEEETLVFEKNAERTFPFPMPGLKLMPPLALNDSDINYPTLWAQLEVGLGFYVKGAGTNCWTDPEIIVRFSKWPLAPL